MTSPDRGTLRALRTGAVVFCVVGVSLAGHVAAGGGVPGLPALAVALAVVAVYAGALTRTQLSIGQLIGAIGAGQVLLHLVFMTSGGEHSGGVAMLAAHAIATVVVAGILARGEDAAWALWCWLRPRLAVPAVEPGVPEDHPDWLPATVSARGQITWLGTSLLLRGPPVTTVRDD